MGDVLAGNHAVWEFDSDSVTIRFARGLRTPRLWHSLRERRIPLKALSEMSLTGGKRDTVVLRAVPRPGADPLMEAAAGQLKESFDPYRLVLPGESAPKAAALADDVRDRLGPATAAERFLVAVPEAGAPLKAYDARVGFDGTAVTFHWSRTGASSTKWKAGDQRYPLGDVTGVVWRSPEGPEGHLRLLLRDAATGEVRPDHDLAAAVFGVGYGAVHESLPFAAAVLAAVRGRRMPVTAAGPRASGGDRLHHLGELHSAGLLTDAEYSALRDRLA
ncbi:DUF4429 domain-containing protein [Streptomyces sp. NPDC046557]|uniref:DUF4429 domain-containing protein n=1 Tax=Streptomyces sp. NPDC046557 TaxID=3155372 RepID=UPI0033DED199